MFLKSMWLLWSLRRTQIWEFAVEHKSPASGKHSSGNWGSRRAESTKIFLIFVYWQGFLKREESSRTKLIVKHSLDPLLRNMFKKSHNFLALWFFFSFYNLRNLHYLHSFQGLNLVSESKYQYLLWIQYDRGQGFGKKALQFSSQLSCPCSHARVLYIYSWVVLGQSFRPSSISSEKPHEPPFSNVITTLSHASFWSCWSPGSQPTSVWVSCSAATFGLFCRSWYPAEQTLHHERRSDSSPHAILH